MTYEQLLNWRLKYDYRMKFDGNRNEEGGAATSGTYVSGSSIIPTVTDNSLRCVTTNINITNAQPAAEKLVGGGTDINEVTSLVYSMFVRVDNVGNKQGFYEQGGGTNWVHIYQYQSQVYFVIGEAGTPKLTLGSGYGALINGQTHHIVCQWDAESDRAEIWIDGVLMAFDATAGVGTELDYHSGDITFGNSADAPDISDVVSTNYLVGYIQDWVAWCGQGLMGKQQIEMLYSTAMDVTLPNEMMNQEHYHYLTINEGFTKAISFNPDYVYRDTTWVHFYMDVNDSLLDDLTSDEIIQRSLIQLPTVTDSPPTDPTNFSLASIGITDIQFSFDNGTDDNGITWYMKWLKNVTAGGAYIYDGALEYGATSVTFSGLQGGTQYQMKLVSVDTIGQLSSGLNSITATTNSAGANFTPYLTTYKTSTSATSACGKTEVETWWHDGLGDYPEIGDRVHKLNDSSYSVIGKNHWFRPDMPLIYAPYAYQVAGDDSSDPDRGLVIAKTSCV